MDEYIKRDDVVKIIDNYSKTVTDEGKVVVDAIRDIVAVITPTADVVEVVRCKDCKHNEMTFTTGAILCRKHTAALRMGNEHFCSYGERKELNAD